MFVNLTTTEKLELVLLYDKRGARSRLDADTFHAKYLNKQPCKDHEYLEYESVWKKVETGLDRYFKH